MSFPFVGFFFLSIYLLKRKEERFSMSTISRSQLYENVNRNIDEVSLSIDIFERKIIKIKNH